MLRYPVKPPQRPQQKAVTKAVARQRRTEALNRRFRLACDMFCCLAAGIVIGGMVKGPIAVPAPKMGDMLLVSKAEIAPGASLADVPAHLVAGPWAHKGQACTLDEAVMQAPGGTLTVLALRPDGVMLSWVGGATARENTCPAPAQVLVSEADYNTLLQITVPRHHYLAR